MWIILPDWLGTSFCGLLRVRNFLLLCRHANVSGLADVAAISRFAKVFQVTRPMKCVDLKRLTVVRLLLLQCVRNVSVGDFRWILTLDCKRFNTYVSNISTFSNFMFKVVCLLIKRQREHCFSFGVYWCDERLIIDFLRWSQKSGPTLQLTSSCFGVRSVSLLSTVLLYDVDEL